MLELLPRGAAFLGLCGALGSEGREVEGWERVKFDGKVGGKRGDEFPQVFHSEAEGAPEGCRAGYAVILQWI